MTQDTHNPGREAAERGLSLMVRSLTPSQRESYQLAATEIAATVERHGGPAVLAIWMASSIYAKHAEEIYAEEQGNQSGSG